MASAAIHRTPPLQPRRRPGKSGPSSSERPSGVSICSYRRTSIVAVVCLEDGFGGCSGDGNFGAMDLIRVFEDDAPMTLASDSKRLFTVGERQISTFHLYSLFGKIGGSVCCLHPDPVGLALSHQAGAALRTAVTLFGKKPVQEWVYPPNWTARNLDACRKVLESSIIQSNCYFLPCAFWRSREVVLQKLQPQKGLYMGERSFVDQDKLILRGLKFHGFHGVKQEEKKLGQKFLVDIDAWLDLSKAGKSDDISDTVSYTDIYRIAKDILEGPSQNLLESVAHLIANATLLQFPEISAVRVKVGKPHVAVHGTIDHLGVEILRYNKQHEMAQTK